MSEENLIRKMIRTMLPVQGSRNNCNRGEEVVLGQSRYTYNIGTTFVAITLLEGVSASSVRYRVIQRCGAPHGGTYNLYYSGHAPAFRSAYHRTPDRQLSVALAITLALKTSER